MRRKVAALIGGSAVIAVNVAALAFVPDSYAVDQIPWMATLVPTFVVGAVLTLRVPLNPIGRLLVAIAVLGSFGNLPGLAEQPGGRWLGAVGAAASTFGIMLLPLVALLFPTGSLPSPRWRIIRNLIVGAAGFGGVAGLLVGGWGGDAKQVIVLSPFYEAVDAIPLGSITYMLFVTAVGFALASLVVRYRTGSTDVRLQLKWLLAGVAYTVAVSAALVVAAGFDFEMTVWRALLIASGLASIPVAIGIAILRYRLYDIDLVINRTVVFVVLAAFITGVYAVVVGAVGSLIGGSGLWPAIGATAVVALAFEPVRDRAQRWANRVVYGERATPYEVLSALATRLPQAEAEAGLLERMAEQLAAGTGASRAGVWLAEDGEYTNAAARPEPPEVRTAASLAELPGSVTPIEHDGEVLGALTVEKGAGEPVTPTEHRLVEDLAGSAGLVLRKLRLDAELAAAAAELEQSRRRLIEAQDAELRRLEQRIDEGAQQRVLGLKVGLSLASRLAEAEGSERTAALLGELGGEAQAAIDEIRSLAKGIYPPLLVSEGLEAALHGLAASAPVPVTIAGSVGRLPAGVEAAVYFTLSEAVTNAIKHGEPPITVELDEGGGRLRFAVTDRGPGFDPAGTAAGSGLANMADRIDALGGSLVVDASPGRATVVRGDVPVASAVPI